jgi:hypothetical protein
MSERVDVTKWIKLGYLQTVKALNDDLDFSLVVGGTTEGSSASFNEAQLAHNITDTGWVKGAEILEAHYDRARVGFGIRELNIGAVRYQTSGYLLTKPYMVGQPIASVQLESDNFVPSEFPDGRYILYSITFDDNNFHEILPRNSGLQIDIPRKLEVNSNSGITVNGQPMSFKLRIELRRPDGEMYATLTPVVRSVKSIVEVVS